MNTERFLRILAGEALELAPFLVTRNWVQRHPANKTERQFETYLNLRKLQADSGRVLEWWREPVLIHIGEGCSYCPDYFANVGGELVLFEVKGYDRPAGAVKAKAAANILAPLPVFYARKERGRFVTERIRALDHARLFRVS